MTEEAAWVFVFLALCLSAVHVHAQQVLSCAVNPVSGQITAVRVPSPSPVAAWGQIYTLLNETGWDRLYIETNASFPDETQAFCAGYLEGSLTAQQIQYWHTGIHVNVFGSKPPSDKLRSFLEQQLAWVCAQAEAGTDTYWEHMRLLLRQFDGLVAGFNHSVKASQQLSVLDFYIMNSMGDLETLLPWLQQPTSSKLLSDRLNERGLDCSGFVRTVNGSVYFGHATWTSYHGMYRLFKRLTLHFSTPGLRAETTTFSSKPAYLSSKDDFYTTSAGLAVMETTNEFKDQTLYSHVTPQTVPVWMRSVLANRLANDGQVWADVFARYNSGTYNNQWMVLDYKEDAEKRFWVVEQMPGYVEARDMSEHLQTQGYWASFNIPFFSKVYNNSGFPNGSSLDGHGAAYLQAPRQLIFARNASSVYTLEDTQRLMRFNNWKVDPLSQGCAVLSFDELIQCSDPAKAVASRYDLRPSPAMFGAVDAKVTSSALMKAGARSVAISGPTHQEQPPFSWADCTTKEYHEGQPTVWDFPWETIGPV